MPTDTVQRNTTVVLLAKTQQNAEDLLLEFADDPRVVAAHVELGDSKYLIAENTTRRSYRSPYCDEATDSGHSSASGLDSR